MYDAATVILACIAIGVMLGLVIGLRKLFIMEEKILKIETHIENLVKKVEHEEIEIKNKLH